MRRTQTPSPVPDVPFIAPLVPHVTAPCDVPGWCGWCGLALPPPADRGRTRRYCDDRCRVQAWRTRTQPRACGLLTEDCRRRHDVLHGWHYPPT